MSSSKTSSSHRSTFVMWSERGIAALVSVVLLSSSVMATDYFYWGGAFGHAESWTFDFVDPAFAVPGAGDSSFFIDFLDVPGQLGFVVPVFASHSVGTLAANDVFLELDLDPDGMGGRTLNLVGVGGAVTLDLFESELAITSFSGLGGTVMASQGVIVGDDNPVESSVLRVINNTTLTASDTEVPGHGTLATNSIYVSQASANLGSTTVGGTLDVDGQGLLTTDALVADGTIPALVRVIESQWTSAASTTIADQHAALLQIRDSLAQLGDLHVGIGAASVGDVEVENLNGSPTTLQIADLFLAHHSADSDVRVKFGAELDAQNAYVGIHPNSSGAIEVDGVGLVNATQVPSRLSIETLTLADHGTAMLEVTNGGAVEVGDMTVGANRTNETNRSLGTVMVDGVGSVLAVDDLLVAGDNGDSQFTVSNSGIAQAETIVAARERAAPLNEISSTINVTTSGTLAATDRFELGGRGKAELTVSNAGFVTAREFIATAQLGSLAEIAVTNPGSSVWVQDAIKLGAAGFATVTVDDGAFMHAKIIRLTNRGGMIAPIGSADVTVRGVGTMMTASQEISVAGNGAATLWIEDHGFVQTPLMLIGINDPENNDGTGQRGFVRMDDGVVSATQVDIFETGTLEGSGIIQDIGGNLSVSNLSGVVHPGYRGLNVEGHYNQGADGRLRLGLAGTSVGDFGTLALDGTATLGGSLVWALESGFAPGLGDSFAVLAAGNINGAFATLVAPPLANGLGWRVDYGNTQVTLEVGHAVPGDVTLDGLANLEDIDALITAIVSQSGLAQFDLNGDGLLDAADRDAWLVSAGQANIGAPYLLADSNLDGVVDGRDFIRWNDNKFLATGTWGQSDWNADGVTDGQDFLLWNDWKFTSSSTQAIPEPTGLFALGGIVLVTFFRTANEE